MDIPVNHEAEFDEYDLIVQFKMQSEESKKLPEEITLGSQIKLGYLSGEGCGRILYGRRHAGRGRGR